MMQLFRINGQEISLACEPQTYLVDLLRQNGFKSVKRACETSSCGICTVLLDGRPILSCTLLATMAVGHDITTVEGMRSEIEDLTQFLSAEGAEQCGFCSPGLALTVLAMKKELQTPTTHNVKHYLSGNLCRCSGYVGQLRAIYRYMGVEA